MTDNETNESGHWFSKTFEGGLPQLLAGPAGKAISRLIGAGVEIPAAWLEGIAQGIRDKSDARSQISQVIAKQVAEMAASDPEVMERAMGNMLARSYRVQKNKDAVAAVAIEDLTNDPPNPESQGPSDDWMMKFERYAEDASSDDLRTMFGKLLAGEIRKPTAISQATLHFVSMLDAQTAQLIERVLPACILNGAALFEIIKPALTVSEIAYIEQSGFWTAEKSVTIKYDSHGIFILRVNGNNMGVAIRGQADSEIILSAAILSRAGKDLIEIVNKPFDFQSLANVVLAKNGVTNFYYGQIVVTDSVGSLPHPIELSKNAVASD